MKPHRIERIPVSQIRIVNPRSRNQFAFRTIVNNIGAIGLKKPITVFPRKPARDGTRYDLVCGQGRLEAVKALGAKDIAAIITDASRKQRYLMSLVENVARRRPPTSELLGEVRRLREARYSITSIAQTLGLGRTYVEGIVRLLKCDEARLVEQVEAGTIPLSIAVKIATANSGELQHTLNEAYQKGDLRGAKLRAVERLITARSSRQRAGQATKSRLSGPELLKEYAATTARQRALVKRAALVHERLAILVASMKQLLTDKAFVRTLVAEGLNAMPEELMSRIKATNEVGA
jgi:ParB family chromosome partitioning protein